MKTTPRGLLSFALIALALLTACGGGGGQSTQPPPAPLSINSEIFPGVVGRPYSWTMTAQNGRPPYKWSATGLPPALSLDSATGTITGTPTTSGEFGVTFQVSDSGSPQQSASLANLGLQVNAALSLFPPNFTTITQYSEIYVSFGATGGVSPYTYSLTGGTLPPTSKFNSAFNSATLTGRALATGQYTFSVMVVDQLSPPDVFTRQITITVAPPPLTVANSLPARLVLNRPYSGLIVASGGTPPYSFDSNGTSLPAGLSLDGNTGQLSGTPSIAANFEFTINVRDSSSPPQLAQETYSMTVGALLGRNDSPATATPIGNGYFSASISPYIDPPNGTPAAGDNDYYKLVSVGGATVHVETSAKRPIFGNPLDTVIEIVDGNGRQFSTCRQPGDTSTNFSSACINDDISSTVLDSALDYQVQGATNVGNAFYVHVLDWRGDARPDMTYVFNVSGLLPPLSIQTTSLDAASRGLPYTQSLAASSGQGAISWSLESGALPPGLALSTGGTVAGTATTDGNYSFTVRATDSGNPPQSVTGTIIIAVVEPLVISSPAVWPDACVKQPYSFAVQTSGGVPPYYFDFSSSGWPPRESGDFYKTGVMTLTPPSTGTYRGEVTVMDAVPRNTWQDVTLTVKECP